MNGKGVNNRESTTINIMKAVAMLSVISAHVVSISSSDIFSYAISLLWNQFGRVGVIVFL